jgi:hypothetical protein
MALLSIIAPIIAISATPAANAASDSYIFYMDPAQLDKIKSSVTTGDSALSSFVDGMQYTSVYAKINGSKQIPFTAGTKVDDFQTPSVGSRNVSYYGDYYCDKDNKIGFERTAKSFHVELKITVKYFAGPPDLKDARTLPGTVTFIEAHFPLSANAPDSGVNLENDYLPPACLPQSLRRGSQPITLSNYSKLSAASKSSWDAPKTSIAIAGEQVAANNPGGGNDNESDSDQCSKTIGALGWVLCPMITIANDTVNTIYNNFVIKELKYQPLTITANGDTDSLGDSLYKVWKSMRDLANVSFVLTFMFIILANALSFNVNAYTIKKMLPRLIAAALLVQASWLIVSLSIDIGNILGRGIGSLIDAAIPNSPSAGSVGDTPVYLKVVATGVVGAIGVGVAAAIGWPTILLAALSALIGVLTVFVTLIARKLILSVLVITAPLAFAAWVLGGESIFKTWFKLFTRIILMYPMIVMIFSLSAVLSAASTPTNGAGVGLLIAGFYPIIAFFLIPWTFKWAGSAMALAGGAIGNIGKRTNKGIRGSQGAKDLQQGYKERGALKAMRGTNFATRRLGSVRAGGFGMTGARTQARLGKIVNKAQKEHGEAISERIGQASNDDLYALATGNSAAGIKGGSLSQVEAIRALGKRRQFDRLRAVHESNNGKMSTSPTWKAATQGMDEIYKQAPDLAQPYNPSNPGEGFEAIRTMSAEQIAELHPSTLEGAINDATTAATLTPKLAAIAASPTLRNKISPQTLSMLHTHQGKFANVGDALGDGSNINGQQFINSLLTAPTQTPKQGATPNRHGNQEYDTSVHSQFT